MNKEKGKYLAYILRHKPEKANLIVEKDGWVLISQLLENTDFTMEELEEIVKSDDKTRYSFNENKDRIRANQGHSIKVKINFEQKIPPVILYHGTAKQNVDSILKHGLNKGSRQYVHLSVDVDTAYKVGVRHGTPIILKIDCKAMVKDGIKFYISENGVWMTEDINPKYINLMI